MPVIRLGDLADVFMEKYAESFERVLEKLPFKIIGVRPGEKMYEVLMTEEEAPFAAETEDMVIILPHTTRGNELSYPGATVVKRKRYDSRIEPLL